MSSEENGAQRVLDLLARKWTIPVVRCLLSGSRRPSELMAALGGISQKVLTQTLRRLERAALVARAAYASVPPRVDYQLTALGRTLIEPLDGLERWVREHGNWMDGSVKKTSAGSKGRKRPRRRRKPGKG